MGRRGDHFRLKVTSRHPDLLAAAAAAALSVTGAIVAQELWRITPTVPLAYIADGQLFLGIIKATVEHGWYLSNPDLGAPLGSDWYDYPVASGDTLQLLLIRALSVFSGNYVVVLHLFYVLGYALTAISAFAVLRLLGISRGPAVVCATLYSLLPFHLALNEAHPFHTAYWVVPIACFLVLAVLLDRPLFARRDGSHGRLAGFASRTTLATLGACVLIGSAGANYYSVFAAGLVVIAGLVAAILYDWRRSVATAGVVAAAILAVVALNGLPSLIYEAENGANGQVANRLPQESEQYSLTLFSLLAPSPGHRIGPLDELRRDYVESSPTPVAASAPGIGMVAAIGFIWLVGFALASILRPAQWRQRWRLHGAAATATLISFLIATTGGFSLLFAHLVSPQLRVWQRFSFFIAFFALLAVASLLDMAIRRLRSGTHGSVAVGALLVVILTLGFLDQTNPSYVPAYDDIRAEFGSDETFVTSIEQELEPNQPCFSCRTYRSRSGGRPAGRTHSTRSVATCTPQICAGAMAPPPPARRTGSPASSMRARRNCLRACRPPASTESSSTAGPIPTTPPSLNPRSPKPSQASPWSRPTAATPSSTSGHSARSSGARTAKRSRACARRR